MKLRVILIIVACLILTGCDTSNSAVEQAGAQAAEQWLSIVDGGSYEKSWVETDPLFQSQMSKTDLVNALGKIRQPLGANISRSLVEAESSSTLSGAPDGEYVVTIFEASFDQKKSATETVTVTMSGNGKWKVVGYFIK